MQGIPSTQRPKPGNKLPLGPLDDVRGTVLEDPFLLARILDADGSLALREKNYELLVGLGSPRPISGDPTRQVPGSFDKLGQYVHQLPGTHSNALVRRLWRSLVLGDAGLGPWGDQLGARERRKLEIARGTKDDPAVSWSARICAMVICNDVDGLKAACTRAGDKRQGLGAAVREQEKMFWDDDDEEDIVELPAGHPFKPYCLTNCVDDCDGEWQRKFLVSIAFAAALVGSTDSVRFIESRFFNERWPLCVFPFDQRGATFLHNLVEYACSYPMLDGPVRSVRALLPRCLDDYDFESLHERHYGGIGNPLHRAAARGHKDLVDALLDGGLDPSVPCGEIGGGINNMIHDMDCDIDEYKDERNEGRKELPLPEHWAEVRGHVKVAQILRNRRKSGFQPDLRNASLPWNSSLPKAGGYQVGHQLKSKNAMRRERQRLARERVEQEAREAEEREKEEERARAAANAADPEKRAKKIKKLLKQIDGIKTKAALGADLNNDQKKKVSTEPQLRDELASLGLHV